MKHTARTYLDHKRCYSCLHSISSLPILTLIKHFRHTVCLYICMKLRPDWLRSFTTWYMYISQKLASRLGARHSSKSVYIARSFLPKNSKSAIYSYQNGFFIAPRRHTVHPSSRPPCLMVNCKSLSPLFQAQPSCPLLSRTSTPSLSATPKSRSSGTNLTRPSPRQRSSSTKSSTKKCDPTPVSQISSAITRYGMTTSTDRPPSCGKPFKPDVSS